MGRVNISLPDPLLESIDGQRGDVPRSTFVRRAVESVLSGEPKVQAQGPKESPDSGAVAPRSSAPTRPSGRRIDTRTPTTLTSMSILTGKGACPDCGKANGVHKGDCPAHPRAGR